MVGVTLGDADTPHHLFCDDGQPQDLQSVTSLGDEILQGMGFAKHAKTSGAQTVITKWPLAGIEIKSKEVAGRSLIMKSPLGVGSLLGKLYSGHVPSPWPWPVLYKNHTLTL